MTQLFIPPDYPSDVINFFEKNFATFSPKKLPVPTKVSSSSIFKDLGWPFLELPYLAPFREIEAEIRALNQSFVQFEPRRASHYKGLSQPKYELREDAKGWKALCLHGISGQAVGHHSNYGFPEEMSVHEVPHRWTEESTRCAVTRQWIESTFSFKEFHRIRIMLMEPNSSIFPHAGGKNSEGVAELGPINIAITNPDGFYFLVENYGIIPFSPGRCFWFAPGHVHSLINLSNQPRYHIIVEGVPSEKFYGDAFNSYLQFEIEMRTSGN